MEKVAASPKSRHLWSKGSKRTKRTITRDTDYAVDSKWEGPNGATPFQAKNPIRRRSWSFRGFVMSALVVAAFAFVQLKLVALSAQLYFAGFDLNGSPRRHRSSAPLPDGGHIRRRLDRGPNCVQAAQHRSLSGSDSADGRYRDPELGTIGGRDRALHSDP